MAENQKLVPVLRFKDEQGSDYPDWEGKLLGEISRFSKGKGISKTDVKENGTVKCIRYGELYTRYGETISNVISSTNVPVSELVLSHKNDVIIPASGETALDIASAACITVEGVALGGDINIIRCQQNGIFLAYYLISKKKDIARLAQGISIVHLYSAQLTSLNLRIPSKQEQQKIASFLSSVDAKIEQLGKKKALLEQYKKGIMQKLFSQEIRFKDEQGKDYPDWEWMHFTKVLKAHPLKKFQIKSSEISRVGPYKVVDQGKELVAGFSDQNGKIFETDGVVVYGDHTTIVKFVDFSFIVGADGTKVLKPTKEGANIKYLYYCLVFYNIKSEGYKRHFSILKQIWLPVSCIGEQQKIADFLSAIDKKIELVAAQLEQARTFKKGLLQRMFI